jgi:hypothetical protein
MNQTRLNDEKTRFWWEIAILMSLAKKSPWVGSDPENRYPGNPRAEKKKP